MIIASRFLNDAVVRFMKPKDHIAFDTVLSIWVTKLREEPNATPRSFMDSTRESIVLHIT